MHAGIIRRAAQQIIASVEALREKQKPGESTTVRAYALELYNEELRDLSSKVLAATATAAADKDGSSSEGGVRIAERPVGKDGRIVPEVGLWGCVSLLAVPHPCQHRDKRVAFWRPVLHWRHGR